MAVINNTNENLHSAKGRLKISNIPLPHQFMSLQKMIPISKVDSLMERVGRPKSKKSAIERCKRRYRSHSIQRDKEIESFMFFLDEKYKQIKDADKWKGFASSPDKTCSPEAKCPKVS